MLDIARGLEYLHTRRPAIIHRDVSSAFRRFADPPQCKSSNILITRAGVAKVGDFGLARVKRSTRSMIRSLVGTVNWQAPELWHPAPRYDYKVDVFSAAMVYWEMLSGWGTGDKVSLSSAARREGLIGHRNTPGKATMSITSTMLSAPSSGARPSPVSASNGAMSLSTCWRGCGIKTQASGRQCRTSLRISSRSSPSATEWTCPLLDLTCHPLPWSNHLLSHLSRSSRVRRVMYPSMVISFPPVILFVACHQHSVPHASTQLDPRRCPNTN